MKCSEFKQVADAEPQNLSAAAQAHVEKCDHCSAIYADLLHTDQAIRNLTAIEVPDSLLERIKNQQSDSSGKSKNTSTAPSKRTSSALWGVAAILILSAALLAGSGFWRNAQENLLAEHFRQSASDYIHQQPQLLKLDQNIDSAQLGRFISAFGGELKQEVSGVRFAEPCGLKPEIVAHLIIDGEKGPITLMYSQNTMISKLVAFNKHNMQGVHYPTETGSVALFADPGEPLDKFVALLDQSIKW